MSKVESTVRVLNEHPDYSTRLDGEEWRAVCNGPRCGWYSGPLPPAKDVRGADAAGRAHRWHVARELLAVSDTPAAPRVVRLPGIHRCAVCGRYKAGTHAEGCTAQRDEVEQ